MNNGTQTIISILVVHETVGCAFNTNAFQNQRLQRIDINRQCNQHKSPLTCLQVGVIILKEISEFWLIIALDQPCVFFFNHTKDKYYK